MVVVVENVIGFMVSNVRRWIESRRRGKVRKKTDSTAGVREHLWLQLHLESPSSLER